MDSGWYRIGIRACFYDTSTDETTCGPYLLSSGAFFKIAPPAPSVTPLPLRKAELTWGAVTLANEYLVQVRKVGGTWQDVGGGWQSSRIHPTDLDNILGGGEGVANDPYIYEFQVRARHRAGTALTSQFSYEVTIEDSPLLDEDGQDYGDSTGNGTTEGEAILRWKEIPEARGNYSIRYRKLRPYGGQHHSSDDAAWRLDSGGYGAWQDANVTLTTASDGLEGATISGLEPREIYAIQVNYPTGSGDSKDWVYSARDAYVWPFDERPGTNSAFPQQGAPPRRMQPSLRRSSPEGITAPLPEAIVLPFCPVK